MHIANNFIVKIHIILLIGSLISTFLTPKLRSMKCNGSDTCFPAAFGVPAGLFIVAIRKKIFHNSFCTFHSYYDLSFSLFPGRSNYEHV